MCCFGVLKAVHSAFTLNISFPNCISMSLLNGTGIDDTLLCGLYNLGMWTWKEQLLTENELQLLSAIQPSICAVLNIVSMPSKTVFLHIVTSKVTFMKKCPFQY